MFGIGHRDQPRRLGDSSQRLHPAREGNDEREAQDPGIRDERQERQSSSGLQQVRGPKPLLGGEAVPHRPPEQSHDRNLRRGTHDQDHPAAAGH